VIFDAVALLLLCLFAALGARRGALASGLALAGLVGAYAVGAGAAWALGDAAADAFALPAPFGAAAAGSIGFAAAALAFGLLGWLVRRAARDAVPGPADRAAGALFGALRGSLVVLAVGVLALWWDAARTLATASTPGASTPLREVTASALEAGAHAAFGSERPEARMAARVVAHPARTLAAARGLLEHPDVAALAQDREFWRLVESGSAEVAVATASFRRIAGEPALRREFAKLGLVDEASAADPKLFRLEVRSALAEVGPRMRRLREDPELRALASDPQVAALARRGDVVALLRHPGFQRVVARALGSEPHSG
jgi:membrane protein required for colicin V production